MRESIIRRLRKAKGVTQAQLAEAVHVEPTNVSKMGEWELRAEQKRAFCLPQACA